MLLLHIGVRLYVRPEGLQTKNQVATLPYDYQYKYSEWEKQDQ
jgi:hypothetical protein